VSSPNVADTEAKSRASDILKSSSAMFACVTI